MGLYGVSCVANSIQEIRVHVREDFARKSTGQLGCNQEILHKFLDLKLSNVDV